MAFLNSQFKKTKLNKLTYLQPSHEYSCSAVREAAFKKTGKFILLISHILKRIKVRVPTKYIVPIDVAQQTAVTQSFISTKFTCT